MMTHDRVELFAALSGAAQGLANVTRRKMFGCDALFANDAVFALVWKEGRIGVKLTDSAAFDEAMALAGAAPWRAGPKTISSWVLLPTEVVDDAHSLAQWVARAHAQAASGTSSGKKANKKVAPPKRAKRA
jgi:TfoX/Sxy family transcriptional regulator of competence genes